MAPKENTNPTPEQLLSVLSHELKSPMVSLKGFLQLLAGGRVPEDKAKQYLEVCQRNLAKLESTTNRFLELMELSLANQGRKHTSLDLSALVKNQCLVHKREAETADVDLVLLLNDPCPVMGNADQLGQMVDILLLQGLKKSPAGEKLTVTTAAKNSRVLLTISDRGREARKDEAINLFNSLSNQPDMDLTKLAYLGIRMCLVQEIVRLHGGEAEISQGEEAGSTVSVSLEAAR